jgi:Leucine-rich repeat (LRR) protein
MEESAFDAFHDLIHCDLSCNHLVGKIPDVFGNMASLTVLNLAHNKLAGELPESLSSLVRLRTLRLDDNDLQGSIPKWFGNLVMLKDLNLSQNRSGAAYDVDRTRLNYFFSVDLRVVLRQYCSAPSLKRSQ